MKELKEYMEAKKKSKCFKVDESRWLQHYPRIHTG